jgi:hypothetical protein
MNAVSLLPPRVEGAPPLRAWILFGIAVFVLVLDVHTPISKLATAYLPALVWLLQHTSIHTDTIKGWSAVQPEVFAQVIVPLKDLTALAAIVVLLIPIFQDVRKKSLLFDKATAITSLGVFVILSLLIFPDRLGIMGKGYAYLSLSPFGFHDASNLIYKRVLMPYVAYVLQWKGIVFYRLFSLLCTYGVLYLTILFFKRKEINISFLGLLSIGTSSYVATQFQSPGYTEPLSFILLLLLFVVPMGTAARLSVVTLSLFAHEASAFILVPLVFLLFSRKEAWITIAVIVLFYAGWIASFGFDISAALASHNMGGESGFAWVLREPLYEIMGIGIAFKILWVVIVAALFSRTRDALFVGAMLCAGIVMTFLGTDTSRMMGFAFLALLVSLTAVLRSQFLSTKKQQILFAVNIMIPSVYIAVNAGIHSFSGIYGFVVTMQLLQP